MCMSNTTKRVKEIRRKTRRKFSSEEKILIMLDGLRGEFMQSTIKRGHTGSRSAGPGSCFKNQVSRGGGQQQNE